jgi:hypothetical protein
VERMIAPILPAAANEIDGGSAAYAAVRTVSSPDGFLD